MDLLEKAIAMAADAHAGQTDKAGEPYILHILRVVLQLRDRTAQTVAALHDIVEDTPVTFEDLEAAGFVSEVVEAVRALTKHEDEAYDGYLARVAANPIARRVKIVDLEDNMRLQRLSQVSDSDLARLRKYHRSWQTLKAIDP
jgi:(p)ppGpp synthase/HD superfamily hydrolase